MDLEKLKILQIEELERIIVNYDGENLLLIADNEYYKILKASPVSKKAVLKNEETTIDSNELEEIKASQIAIDDIPNDTVDVVIICHSLYKQKDAYQLLEKVRKVLSPAGHLFILESNPYSMLGLKFMYANLGDLSLYRINMLDSYRLKYWMRSLSFEIISHRKLYHTKRIFNLRVNDSFILIAKKTTLARNKRIINKIVKRLVSPGEEVSAGLKKTKNYPKN